MVAEDMNDISLGIDLQSFYCLHLSRSIRLDETGLYVSTGFGFCMWDSLQALYVLS